MKQVVIMMFFVFGLSFTYAQEFTKRRKQIKKIEFIGKGIKVVAVLKTEISSSKETKKRKRISGIPMRSPTRNCYNITAKKELGERFIGNKTMFEVLHFSESRVYIQN